MADGNAFVKSPSVLKKEKSNLEDYIKYKIFMTFQLLTKIITSVKWYNIIEVIIMCYREHLVFYTFLPDSMDKSVNVLNQCFK